MQILVTLLIISASAAVAFRTTGTVGPGHVPSGASIGSSTLQSACNTSVSSPQPKQPPKPPSPRANSPPSPRPKQPPKSPWPRPNPPPWPSPNPPPSPRPNPPPSPRPKRTPSPYSKPPQPHSRSPSPSPPGKPRPAPATADSCLDFPVRMAVAVLNEGSLTNRFCMEIASTVTALRPEALRSACTTSVMKGGLRELRLQTSEDVTFSMGAYVNRTYIELPATNDRYISVPLGNLQLQGEAVQVCLGSITYIVNENLFASGPRGTLVTRNFVTWYSAPVTYSLTSWDGSCSVTCITQMVTGEEKFSPATPPALPRPPFDSPSRPPIPPPPLSPGAGGRNMACAGSVADTDCTGAFFRCGWTVRDAPTKLALFAIRNSNVDRRCQRCPRNPNAWCGNGQRAIYCCAL